MKENIQRKYDLILKLIEQYKGGNEYNAELIKNFLDEQSEQEYAKLVFKDSFNLFRKAAACKNTELLGKLIACDVDIYNAEVLIGFIKYREEQYVIKNLVNALRAFDPKMPVFNYDDYELFYAAIDADNSILLDMIFDNVDQSKLKHELTNNNNELNDHPLIYAAKNNKIRAITSIIERAKMLGIEDKMASHIYNHTIFALKPDTTITSSDTYKTKTLDTSIINTMPSEEKPHETKDSKNPTSNDLTSPAAASFSAYSDTDTAPVATAAATSSTRLSPCASRKRNNITLTGASTTHVSTITSISLGNDIEKFHKRLRHEIDSSSPILSTSVSTSSSSSSHILTHSYTSEESLSHTERLTIRGNTSLSMSTP
jgi:hypothetical protein